MWATPTARDWKDGADPSEAAPTNGLLGRQAPRWHSRPDPTTPTGGADGSQPAAPLLLNPDFVEALMGLPSGWISFACLATASSLLRPPSLGASRSSDSEASDEA